jgi:hypothetical protein
MTTTDIARYDGPTGWVELLGPAHELANAIARTEFVPTALRNRPEAVMAAILAGHELGVSPMQALSKIHIVEGRPAPAAELMRAMAMAHGHEVWVEESNNTRVVVCGKRAGQEHVTKVQWTLDDAKKAGLANKNVWQKYPRAMLLARASAELCRLVFPDVLGGMSYSREEVEDGFGVDPYEDATIIDADVVGDDVAAGPAPATRQRAPRKATARTTKKAAAAAPRAATPGPSSAPQPPLPGEDEEPPTGEITTSMRDDNYIAMKARGVGIDHHVIVRAVTNGRVESSKEIDEDEKAQVLAAISDVHEGRRVLTLSGDDVPQLVDHDPDADKPIDDEQRATLAKELEALTGPEKVALSARVKGVVPNYKGDRFTVRHLFLTLDRFPEASESAEDEAAAEPAAADAGLPFDD